MIQIGFFGIRNAGKSSLVNKITNQPMSVVSNIKGTTTDPVKKRMELLPLGPVVIIDTPGFDDDGEIGEKRIITTKRILRTCDIAILVTEAGRELNSREKELILIFKERKIPYLIVWNKVDLIDSNSNIVKMNDTINIQTSTIKNIGIEELKNAIGKIALTKEKDIHFVSDFIQEKDIVILVTPIDGSAPKGRIILPQQLAIRDILDKHAIPMLAQVEELSKLITMLKDKIKLVITDSQAFNKVKDIVPEEIDLTSFSILMARYKGFLEIAIDGAKTINNLQNGANILIAEGCTHHKQCGDIGTVKLPKMLKTYTNKNFNFEWTNGTGFPEDITYYDLVIHCGGCMLNDNEIQFRINEIRKNKIPFTNYGTIISYMQGILDRCIKIIKEMNVK